MSTFTQIAIDIMPLNQTHLTLIVEEDENYSRLLVKAFRKKSPHCQLEFFLNGQALLDRLNQIGRILPDLILMDLSARDLGGLSALRQVRQDQRLKWIPALTLSDSHSPSDIALSYEAGTNSHVIKPVRLKELYQFVEMTRRYWLETINTPFGVGQSHQKKHCLSDRALFDNCIDFLPVSKPFSQKNWAMFYVYGAKLNEGVFVSIN
ncbi:response regulator [Larkinella sp. C7]|uniref:response regulator n=1 Tax=Larkinella sp. C7 TaxID=2576607 RepID=UPI001111352E|nr:response regulator [Larkinella sp. C7]